MVIKTMGTQILNWLTGISKYEFLAIAISIVSIIIACKTQKKIEYFAKFNVEIKILPSVILFPDKYNKKKCGIMLHITNKSVLPISITHVSFNNNYSTFQELYQNDYEELDNLKPKITTKPTPLYLKSYESQAGFFILYSTKGGTSLEGGVYNITVLTSRGELKYTKELSFTLIS